MEHFKFEAVCLTLYMHPKEFWITGCMMPSPEESLAWLLSMEEYIQEEPVGLFFAVTRRIVDYEKGSLLLLVSFS
jgi:hypothetical protein